MSRPSAPKAVFEQSTKFFPEAIFNDAIYDEINAGIKYQQPVGYTNGDIGKKWHGKASVKPTMVHMLLCSEARVSDIVYLNG